MSTDANKALVRRYIAEAWNNQNLAVLDEIVVDPVRYRTIITNLHIAYPDLQFRIDALLAEGDLVAYRWTACGTHELGVHLRWTGMSFHRIQAGKIVEDWFESDRLTLLEQLGVFPGTQRPDT